MIEVNQPRAQVTHDLAEELAALDDVVGFDPARALDRARRLQEAAEQAGDHDSTVSALLWQAEAHQRDGDPAASAGVITRTRETLAPLTAEHAVRASWLLSRVHTDLGDRPTALEHVMDAVGAFTDDVPRRLRTRVLIKVADLLDELGAREDSLIWYSRAEELAQGDGRMHMLVVNNRAYGALEAGEGDEALEQARLLTTLSEHYGRPLNADALDTVARIHLLRGDPAAAAETSRRAVDATQTLETKVADALPEYLLTLAVAQRELGEAATAARTLERARALCGPEGFARTKARILEEEAEVRAALGDYRAAYETHKAFYLADQELLSQQREAQARARQTIFETVTAREEAARYREEARRDPLTGLWNRLYVEERLPLMLREQPSHTGVLSVALLDLDHFKSVNDTFSHEVGDEVLRVVAGLLDAAAARAPGSFAARLGGEELLLILATDDRGTALRIVDDVRAAVRGYAWSPITPGRVVTLSGGIATATAEDTRSSLLARADAQLYAAKSAGRNRICTDAI
ncbi:tetratricopeptide repeat-containing diguanylate cyclase [Kineosporia succinea]|uniref:Diguanylate cyclase (GGDEF)-like protein n=1 Tax=Kineosporia succinea TaxID=84632 RepID=A0ABT9PEW5_9ACTN|nr:GGDEF domain-containing protein [Kineosporia succinea]MDP9831249.1 diguanylate cyclase (GGDEF)-like protein [Kineosporia succinea]